MAYINVTLSIFNDIVEIPITPSILSVNSISSINQQVRLSLQSGTSFAHLSSYGGSKYYGIKDTGFSVHGEAAHHCHRKWNGWMPGDRTLGRF